MAAIKDWSYGYNCILGSKNCVVALMGKEYLPTFKTNCVVSFSKGSTKALLGKEIWVLIVGLNMMNTTTGNLFYFWRN